MATIPIRSDNAYVGIALQASQGTAVAPTIFPRWMEGSQIEFDAKFEDVWEGDGSRRISTIIKNSQRTKIKLICTPRQGEAGFLEKMALGSGGDTITAGGVNTTTTSTVTGGTSTTVTVTSGTNLVSPATGKIRILVDTGANAELVTFSLPISTLTMTVDASYNSGKFSLNHASGVAFVSPFAVNSSVNTTTTVGASSIIVNNNMGLSGFPLTLCMSVGTANEEFVAFSGVTGAGPYTLTVAATYNGGTMLFAHTAADFVCAQASHVITDQIVSSYYTVEVGLGSLNSQGGATLRVRDCQVDSIKRSAKAGGLLMYELEISGLVVTTQGSPATPTFENHLPFIFYQGVWTLDGSTTGDALAVEMFDITQKNGVDLVQTEAVTMAAQIFGQLKVDLTIEIVYQSTTTYLNKVYMGGAAGTTDTAAVWSGSLTLIFSAADNFSSVQYKVLTLLYTKASLPVPKVDGKHYKQQLQASSTSAQSQNAYVLQTTVASTTGTPY